MKRGFRNIALLGLLISLLLGACVLPTTHRYNIYFAFETPSEGETYLVFSPVHINIYIWVPFPPGYRPYYGPGGLPILNQVVLFANGVEIGNAEEVRLDSGDPAYSYYVRGETNQTFHAFRNWVPPRAGLYYIQAQAILMLGSPVNGDYSDAVEICVLESATSPAVCEPTPTPSASTPFPFSAPFSFSTPTFIATPASARDCPSGTFFAEQTHKCIPVQIVTAKPGHGSGCSQYGDASGCTSNGCSWDKPSSTCR